MKKLFTLIAALSFLTFSAWASEAAAAKANDSKASVEKKVSDANKTAPKEQAKKKAEGK